MVMVKQTHLIYLFQDPCDIVYKAAYRIEKCLEMSRLF
jgi:hypothetical protein